ncbi:MAG: hypothetical protein KDC49_15265 [Saprospiraceae bacterium]|nr:hypothetical protein [Saprospiraceae bacterium]
MRMIRHILLLMILTPIILHAQTWDGGGDGTSWQDSLNWVGDQIPPQDSVVTFNASTANIVVTGYAPNRPRRLNISGTYQVILNMDSLTIGDGIMVDHGINMNDFASLLILNGTYNINTPSNRNGFSIFASTDSADVIIEDNAFVNINGSQIGVNLASASSMFTNNGTLHISNVSADGIRVVDSSGIFYNNGPLTIDLAASDGIENAGTFVSSYTLTINSAKQLGVNNKASGSFTVNRFELIINGGGITTDGINNEGTFTNGPEGTIYVSIPTDDCIETLGKTFTNLGTINITMKEGANTGQNGVAVGNDTKIGSFINVSKNSLNILSADAATARLIAIADGSSLQNFGTISLEDSVSSGSIFYTNGSVINELGGRIDLGSAGRINVASNGSFINSGFLTTDRAAAGIIRSGATANVINNAYYDYGAQSGFSIGATGTETDLGIDLQNPNDVLINAGESCDIDIAEASYEFLFLGDSLGMTSETGAFTIPDSSINGDTAVLVNASFPEVQIKVINYCAQALPVEFESFDLSLVNEGVLLKWSTASERNNSHFEAQKSKDGLNFTSFAVVSPKDAYDRSEQYLALDATPHEGHNYYRIKQVDLDGTASYTDIKQIYFGKVETLGLYPNYAQRGKDLLLNIPIDQQSQLTTPTIYNSVGRQMAPAYKISDQSYRISTDQLSPGTYFIVTGVNGKTLPFVIFE